MKHENDPRETIWKAVGDLTNKDVCYSQVLIGVYVRPEKTAGGIILTQTTRQEDVYQGKVGMILKKGPLAFKDTDDLKFNGFDPQVGDWVVIRASDGWALKINEQNCRMVSDVGIRMVIDNPDEIW